MSAFRGARLLASLGHHGMKCNRLHQRRIVSLGLTSLCQVTMKKQAFLDTNALPVNKFDLSSVGILSNTLSSLFSTEAMSLSEDDSSEVAEEDSEAGRLIKQVSKWPSPVNQVDKHTIRRKYTIFIGGNDFNHNEEYLKDLFTQFGEVYDVTVPHKETYDEIPCRPGQYRFGFVSFTNHASLKNAILAATVTGADETTIEIKERSNITRKVENKQTFIVNGLPDDITIDQVHDYFQSFGDIELINLVLKSYSAESSNVKRNYAFVLFKQGCNVQSLPHIHHNIGSMNIIVDNVGQRTQRQSRDRCKMIFLSGVNEDITEEKVKLHFNVIGLVNNATLFTDVDGISNGLGVVHFNNKEDAISAAEVRWHDIGASNIKAQLLGILNE